MHRRIALLPLLLAAAAFAAGCAGTAPQPSGRRNAVVGADGEISLGDAVAEIAMGMVGTPYRYGGTDPRQGFDCSGLVFYTYTQAGYRVPRTSQELFRAARKIALGDAGAGDVMFFQDQEKLSHVGIYLGDGLFIHAPATGQTVTVASIDAPYYQRNLVAVGRLLPN
ncbi:MAG TPA: C40 family peptidase [Gammaproteobacteria bacterium]|nr:C40 family peptidase [Gammaproteobacteria bacterium]